MMETITLLKNPHFWVFHFNTTNRKMPWRTFLCVLLVILLGAVQIDSFPRQAARPSRPADTGLRKKFNLKPKPSLLTTKTKASTSTKVAGVDAEESSFAISKLTSQERVQKIIARAGLCSRREAQTMIMDGRVTLNGRVITETGAKCNARKDHIAVDGKGVQLPHVKDIHWLALNKPKGVLTTMKDEKGRDTVLKFIPKANELRLVPVGGMDRDATGLLLLTNEVGWIHALSHASFEHHKRYQVVMKGLPTVTALNSLAEGKLDGLAACDCAIIDVDRRAGLCMLDAVLTNPMPNLLEEMARALGCELVNSRRTEFGPIKMKMLKKGDWRELTPGEVAALKESCKPRNRKQNPMAKLSH